MDRRVQPRPIFQAVLNGETLNDVQSVHWDATPHALVRLTIEQKTEEGTITHDCFWRSGYHLVIKGTEP